MSEMPVAAINAVLAQYDLPGTLKCVEPIVQGHINHTFRVTLVDASSGLRSTYVVQQINQHVFREPEKVMHNVRQIAQHVQGLEDPGHCSILQFLDTRTGVNYVRLEGQYWRVSPFVENSISYDVVEDSRIVCRAGYAFGRFQAMLADLPMEDLAETIPDFHNTPKRLQDFFAVVQEDPVGRAGEVSREIAFFEKHRELVSQLELLREQGMLPRRVTHNDTKINNILMDQKSGEPVCVLDLDTVMPGLVAMDFGDAIRTAGNTALEDERDLSKVNLHMPHYEAFTRGFVGVCRATLTPLEIDTLALGAVTITTEQAARFLGDYLGGDRYYRIHRPQHNLERARCQITLAQRMLDRMDEMEAVVRKYALAADVSC